MSITFFIRDLKSEQINVTKVRVLIEAVVAIVIDSQNSEFLLLAKNAVIHSFIFVSSLTMTKLWLCFIIITYSISSYSFASLYEFETCCWCEYSSYRLEIAAFRTVHTIYCDDGRNWRKPSRK